MILIDKHLLEKFKRIWKWDRFRKRIFNPRKDREYFECLFYLAGSNEKGIIVDAEKIRYNLDFGGCYGMPRFTETELTSATLKLMNKNLYCDTIIRIDSVGELGITMIDNPELHKPDQDKNLRDMRMLTIRHPDEIFSVSPNGIFGLEKWETV